MIYLYGSVKYLKFTACGEQTIKRQSGKQKALVKQFRAHRDNYHVG